MTRQPDGYICYPPRGSSQDFLTCRSFVHTRPNSNPKLASTLLGCLCCRQGNFNHQDFLVSFLSRSHVLLHRIPSSINLPVLTWP